MSNDTQPLSPDQAPEEETFTPDYREAWKELKTAFSPLTQLLKDVPLYPKPIHVHGPFTFLLNPNHNALRGCQTCGQAWVGYMAGNETTLQWHAVEEPLEEA